MANNFVKYSLVDAFAESAFKGNPAAVCFLEGDGRPEDERWLQSVAAEFNIPATCFLTRLTESEPRDSLTRPPIPRFRLRWFSPAAELGLCGHGTLASAHALFTSGKIESNIIEFITISGTVTAKKVPDSKPSDVCNAQNGEAHNKGFFIELNFPSDPSTEFVSAESSLISKALGVTSVIAIRRTTLDKLIVVLPSAKCVADVQPDFGALEKCPGVGIVVTGIAPPESGFDFHSRFFSPKFKIPEDPVCGSAHCALASYWSKELGKCDFVAYQASPRGGVLNLHLDEQSQRVLMQGKACTVMEGTILV